VRFIALQRKGECDDFAEGFKNCGTGEADLPHYMADGLRKAEATIAANNGATARRLMVLFGWDTIKQAERHTRKADQKQLAEAAMHLLGKR